MGFFDEEDTTSTTETTQDGQEGGVNPQQGQEDTPPATPPVGLDQKVGDLLPEDLKDNNILSRYKDRTLKEYFQDTIEARKTMSNMVKVPPTDADFDTKKEYLYGVMDKLGLEKPPVSMGDYKFDMSDIPEGLDEDPSMTEWARGAFYDARLTNEQANAIIKAWNKHIGNQMGDLKEARERSYKAASEEFKKEWGEKYDNNLRVVAQTVNKIFPVTLVDKLKKANLDNDPELIRSIYELNKNYFAEHNADPGLGSDFSSEGGLTTAEKMRKILSDPNWKTDISLQKEYQRLAELNAKTHNKVVR